MTPITISYTRGATVNRGNYSNEKIEIGVTAQLENDNAEEIEATFMRLRDWVCRKLKEEIHPQRTLL